MKGNRSQKRGTKTKKEDPRDFCRISLFRYRYRKIKSERPRFLRGTKLRGTRPEDLDLSQLDPSKVGSTGRVLASISIAGIGPSRRSCRPLLDGQNDSRQ